MFVKAIFYCLMILMSIDIIYLEGNINDRVEVVTKSNKFDEDSDKWPIEQEWHNKLIRGEHYSTYLGNDIEKSEKQLNSIVTGELGTGIILNEFSMPEQEIYRRKALYNRHAFEAYVSEMISVERSLPDRRSQWCLDQYPVLPHLPRTSVIICFHNEALSTLLRTLYSVINRSSNTLLTEILLFDDASTLNHLKERLDRIIQEREELRNKVRLIRLTDRHGLIKCRLEGVRKAKSRVLTFLDSHVEASPGWLTPLLHRIYENKGVIVSPVIDIVNDTTFYYQLIENDLTGMFTWGMEFEWHELPSNQASEKKIKWQPHSSPVLAGGLFAIEKARFQQLGLYDEGMNIWGGENLELSFKAWMCPPDMNTSANRIEIIPCSHVGHVFRSWSPYNIKPESILRNNLRVAEVWMDEYKYLIYNRLGNYHLPLEERLGDFGDVTYRKSLRASMKCHSFKWYLENVAQQIPYSSIQAAGEIKNVKHNLCLDKSDTAQLVGQPVNLLSCHGLGGNQHWWMDMDGRIIKDFSCLGTLPHSTVLSMLPCSEAGQWIFNSTTGLIHKKYNIGLCISANNFGINIDKNEQAYNSIEIRNCDTENSAQVFEFTRFNSSGIKHKDLAKPVVLT